MTLNRDLLLALEFVSEGRRAQVARPMARALFATESFQAEAEDLRQQSRGWTMGAGIQGLGVGDKLVEGKSVGQLALRVYVERKLPKLKCKNPVPGKLRVPEVGEVDTDVVEIGQVEAELFTTKARPAMPGCGLGHPAVTVGTLGCLVRKRGEESAVYVLSNSHVLADSGNANPGDWISQPAAADEGTVPPDGLARLSEFQPFDYRSGFPNLIDAAIAKVRSKQSVTDEIRLLGIKPAGVSHTLRRGMRVKKVGRTTDFTLGQIQDIDFRVRIPYRRQGSPRKVMVGFRDQVLCTRYSQGGDSGSIVLNRRDRVVGLHFAGSPSASIFNRIANVFDTFDIELA